MEFSAFSTALEGMLNTGFASDLDAAAKYLHDLDIHYLDAFHGAYRRDPGAFDLYTQKLGFRINSLIGPSESTSEDPAVRKGAENHRHWERRPGHRCPAQLSTGGYSGLRCESGWWYCQYDPPTVGRKGN